MKLGELIQTLERMQQARGVSMLSQRGSVIRRWGYQGASDPGLPTQLMQPQTDPLRRS